MGKKDTDASEKYMGTKEGAQTQQFKDVKKKSWFNITKYANK